MRPPRWLTFGRTPGSTILALGMTAALLLAALPQSTVAASTTKSPFFGSTPYIPLFTVADVCSSIQSINNQTGATLAAALKNLSTWYRHIHSDASNTFDLGKTCQGTSSTTLAAKLTQLGITVSQYRNGSDVSQSNPLAPLLIHEAANIEANAPLGIGVFWPGDWSPFLPSNDTSTASRLPADMTASDTGIAVTPAGSARPLNTPTTWPFISSRGTGLQPGAFSQDTYNFVSWIRIDDEMMKIVANPTTDISGNTALTIERGTFGTTPAVHLAGTRVMSPEYVGNQNAGTSDQNFNGTPFRADPKFPLRYGIKIWQPAGNGWIISRINATLGPGLQGYNAIWSDVSSCQAYNYASSHGEQIAAWDDTPQTKMTVAAWGQHQLEKLAAFRAAFPGVKFIANNYRLRPDPVIDPCNNQILQQGAWDGVDLESFLKGTPNPTIDWNTEMPQTFQVLLNNWPATFWVRFSRGIVTGQAQRTRFSYGSVLLAYETTATTFQFGAIFGLVKPDNLFFWNWGTPQGAPTSISDVAVAGTPLYQRSFTNGIVLVNPSASSYTYNLHKTYYDVVNLTSGNPTPVTSVTIASGDAAFLLYSLT